VFVQGWGIRLYIRWFGEGGTILYGFGFTLASFLFFAFLPNTPFGGLLAILWCPVSALGEVTLPAIQGRLSRLAPPDAQGELQGVIASTRSAALMIGPLAMTAIFAAALNRDGDPFYGAPYLLSALLMAACIALFLRTRAPDHPPAT